MYESYLKRVLDVIVCLLLVTILFVPLIIVGIICLCVHGLPLFYSQSRPGKNGVVFKILKLRTMLDLRDGRGELLSDKLRITRFGHLLRRSSIDELPGIWNVLKGDMSLVGPRPLLVEYLPLYSKEQARRHNVRPGITGWAQVNGRNAISWEDKFKLDVWYIENQSFWLDLKIICLTVKKVLVKEGISQKGEATMAKFTGTEK